MKPHTPSSRSRTSRTFAFSEKHEQKALRILFIGWAIALLYFPSGLFHTFLGSKVYARDALLGLHLIASIHFLQQAGLLRRLLRYSWMLLIVPLAVLPALANREFAVEAVTLAKWAALWIDWMILGMLLVLVPLPPKPLIVLGSLTLLLLLTDAACGFHEYTTNQYLFSTRGERSALGVAIGREEVLGGKQIRLKGLQRDVFSFANLMAASCVGGVVFATVSRRPIWRVVGWIWAMPFAGMLFASGGRSAFFGVAAALAAATALQIAPDITRRYLRRALLVWLAFAILISAIGVGPLTAEISDRFLKHNRAGDSRSAFMRDQNWAGINHAIATVPAVVLCGAPLAALLDPHIDPIYHWADNEYLWLLYHTGIPGIFAVLLYFGSLARFNSSRDTATISFTLFLLFIMGEGIARESLAFLGCLPLFVSAGAMIAPRGRSTEKVAPARRLLEVPA